MGDTDRAYECLKKLAELDWPPALNELGQYLLFVEGADHDEAKGLAMLERAARLDNWPAQAG